MVVSDTGEDCKNKLFDVNDDDYNDENDDKIKYQKISNWVGELN